MAAMAPPDLFCAGPVAGALAAGPELCGELVLLPLRRGLRGLVPASQALVRGRQHLVRATGAALRVDGVVVAARLAHDDRLRDAEVTEPLAHRLARTARSAAARLLERPHLIAP